MQSTLHSALGHDTASLSALHSLRLYLHRLGQQGPALGLMPPQPSPSLQPPPPPPPLAPPRQPHVPQPQQYTSLRQYMTSGSSSGGGVSPRAGGSGGGGSGGGGSSGGGEVRGRPLVPSFSPWNSGGSVGSGGGGGGGTSAVQETSGAGRGPLALLREVRDWKP